MTALIHFIAEESLTAISVELFGEDTDRDRQTVLNGIAQARKLYQNSWYPDFDGFIQLTNGGKLDCEEYVDAIVPAAAWESPELVQK